MDQQMKRESDGHVVLRWLWGCVCLYLRVMVGGIVIALAFYLLALIVGAIFGVNTGGYGS